jgi:flagellar hook-basal body complex protein FliE
VSVPRIDRSQIDAMMAQLKAAASATSAAPLSKGLDAPSGVGRKGFADVLKDNLNQVNAAQQNADALGKRFALGDDSVSLSDVMIATQKSSISFQAAVQVRNKLVSAYHDIISMQI